MRPDLAPPVSQNLLEYLEKTFPDKAQEKGDSAEDARWKAAQVSVVRHLRVLFNSQLGNFAK